MKNQGFSRVSARSGSTSATATLSNLQPGDGLGALCSQVVYCSTCFVAQPCSVTHFTRHCSLIPSAPPSYPRRTSDLSAGVSGHRESPANHVAEGFHFRATCRPALPYRPADTPVVNLGAEGLSAGLADDPLGDHSGAAPSRPRRTSDLGAGVQTTAMPPRRGSEGHHVGSEPVPETRY